MSVFAQPPRRQPLHTLYGGAHLYKFDATRKLGGLALRSLEESVKEAGGLANLAPWLSTIDSAIRDTAFERTRAKLAREPVEDQRIDFEDGFGPRGGAEEDAEAVRAAHEVAKAAAEGLLPPYIGIRIRSFASATRARAERTLRLFFETLGERHAPIVVTLPKVEGIAEARDFANTVLAIPGAKNALLELMVETPRSLMDESGRCPLPDFIAGLGAQAFALHLGAYDLTSELGVPAPAQRLGHPACAQARFLMQCAAAGKSVHVADGATTHLPLRSATSGFDAVKRGWTLHGENIIAALESGIYQGWDLHPAQLPIRYIALYTYFLETRDAMAGRLKAFLENAAKATRVGAAFDDAATGLALLAFFRRGYLCGAFDEADLAAAGLTKETALLPLAAISAAAVRGDTEGA